MEFRKWHRNLDKEYPQAKACYDLSLLGPPYPGCAALSLYISDTSEKNSSEE